MYSDTDLLDRMYANFENTSKKLGAVRPLIERQNKKTHFMNFGKFCESINRDKNTIKKFFEDELSIQMSINSHDSLIIDRMYQPAEITKICENYIKRYVICQEPKCNSGNTQIVKENRITYLVCNGWNSKKAI